MESQLVVTRFLLVLTTILCFLHCVSCVEFQVGERVGWAVPPKNNTRFYNHWASHERFKLGDMFQVQERFGNGSEPFELRNMRLDASKLLSNTGNTTYTLDRSGFFYFISGAAGHCEKGQKLIVWVIEQDESSKGRSSESSPATKYSAVLFYVIGFAMATFHAFHL